MIRTGKNLPAMQETWVEFLGCAYLYIYILFNIHVNSGYHRGFNCFYGFLLFQKFNYQFYYCKLLLSSICVSH